MESNEILYLAIVLFTCYGFNLAQGLRAAINRGDTVRVTPKILCSIYCISVSIIAIKIVPAFSELFTFLHVFIILFQGAMIWYPKPD
tara:strand:- start:144 stop:404 length:261 start_codon:yes stop_codon:yes gene_type:complete